MAGSISGIDWVSRMPVSGTHTVSAAEGGAGKASIDSGMAGATGFIVQVMRSNIDLTTSSKISMAAGVVSVETNSAGSAFTLTADDVINWIVF